MLAIVQLTSTDEVDTFNYLLLMLVRLRFRELPYPGTAITRRVQQNDMIL